MPIPVSQHYIEQDIYINVIHTILNSRFKELDQLCLNQDQDHDCIHHLDSQHHQSISLNIVEKETNYLLERWMISLDESPKSVGNISQCVSSLPLSHCSLDLYLITNFSHQPDKQCCSYVSNEHPSIEFQSNSQLKAQQVHLNRVSIEVIYDENIPTNTKIDFMPWSTMQDPLPVEDNIHPLSKQETPTSLLKTSIPAIVSPNTPFVAIRRLSRLSLSAIESEEIEDEPPSFSIPIPGSSSCMQYTHNNKRSTVAFSTSPTNHRFLSPTLYDFLGERRNSCMDHHHHGCFVGSFEESLFSGRMSSMPSKPIMFHSQIGVLGYGECKPSLKCPPHWSILFPATFYHLPQQDQDDTPVTPYVGAVDIGDYTLNELKKTASPGYRIPPKGQLQVVIKNPNKTAVKLFLIPYDFVDMPKNTKTFLRQKSYAQGTKRLRYAIHVQICRTEKKRIYLYKTMKVVFSNQHMDAREKFDVVCEGPKEPVYIPL